jgi:hypothetical protein
MGCSDSSIKVKDKNISIKVYPIEDLNDKAIHNFSEYAQSWLIHDEYRNYFKIKITNLSNEYIYIDNHHKIIRRNVWFTGEKVSGPGGHFSSDLVSKIDVLAPKESGEYVYLLESIRKDVESIKSFLTYVKTPKRDVEEAKEILNTWNTKRIIWIDMLHKRHKPHEFHPADPSIPTKE